MADIADSNITDPNTYRKNDGDNWIFSHFPKYGKGNDLPRIGFHKISAQHPQVTLGSTAARTEADIQATIVVKRGKKYDFDNDGENEEEENLSDYLEEKVRDVIENNQSQLQNLGDDVSYVIPIDNIVRKPEGKNIIFQAITFEARIDNC